MDRNSAILGTDREMAIFTDADHFSMSKFESASGDDYELVSGNLQLLIQEALELAKKDPYFKQLDLPGKST